MVERRNVKKTTGPPLESSPSEDLDQDKSEAKKSKTFRPKFVTKPSTTMIQEGMDLLDYIFSHPTTTTSISTSTLQVTPPITAEVTPETQMLVDALLSTPLVVTISSSPSVQIPVTTSSPTASTVPPSYSSVPPHNTRRSTHTWYLQL
ncbi:hypothetical protein L1987_06894 [Smallanthus sonchifolius]|uniref:Uncharacterized protein n=1 Tax=Smallanthus sonchifolius TaxID=185202 RepID=A0ACB9JZE5_9ASTR|nr:hypothetical protein L1987_06894 [Smallanthus sonchifolius]